MTPERFCALLDAHGSDFRRWPEAERAGARMLAAGDPELHQRLAEAALLDGWLDSHAVAAADDVLMQRIAAGAAHAAHAAVAGGAVDAADGADATIAPDASARVASVPADPAPTHEARWKARWWWPGAGLVGIGLAGTLAGAFVVSAALRIAAPPATTDWPERATAFTELPADWSEE